ncbi:hypothetical protein FOXB_09458 [Fusarium oxysporum f. sp. conglutinans Fo5176]|uniref:PiggyBac transposable element-derived protein domain-containing protein n=1 Tax=Fusarium oxysporum (strain Fo5176) TaxID=660025 RepID=F9FSS7_FUSOF|nr:hypothetical protein FOXB_09458 [Fusarium oxysporum f. sp. conglutinans Fo5176]
MNSQSILEESQALNTYEDKSFIKEDHSHQLHSNDPTRIAVFPAETDRGTNFEPFWKHPMTKNTRLRAWQGTSVAEVYVWLGMKPGQQRPEHSIIKFMPYWKFQILHRYLRTLDHTKIDKTGPLPKVFQACDEWSDHIQAASAEIFFPGSHLAVDECDVVALASTLPKATYHVFVDNLFSTPPLFRKLRDHGYGATGIACPNCVIHKDLKRDKNLDKSGHCDYAFNEVRAIPTRDNKVNQIAWKDNSLVLFITTVFRGDELTNKKRKKPSADHLRTQPTQPEFGEENTKVIPIPTVAAAYNDEIDHVDRDLS